MHLDDQLVVALVGRMLPLPARSNDHVHPVAGLGRGHALHRGAEVGHVQTLAEGRRQRGLEKVHHQILALRLDVDAHLAAGQIHHDAAAVVRATAEVDVPQPHHMPVDAGGKGAGSHIRNRGRCHGIERDQHRLAADGGAVIGGLLQAQHHTGTLTALHDLGRPQIALVELDHAARQLAAHARKIECNPCRTLYHEAFRHLGQRLCHVDANHFGTALQGARDVFDGILCHGCRAGDDCSQPHQTAHAQPAKRMTHGFHFLVPSLVPSCRSSVVVRSIHSPAASCAISCSVT